MRTNTAKSVKSTRQAIECLIELEEKHIFNLKGTHHLFQEVGSIRANLGRVADPRGQEGAIGPPGFPERGIDP